MLCRPLPSSLLVVLLAVFVAGGASAQGAMPYIAYPSDTSIGIAANNAPLGRNANGSTDDARSQIVIPAAFLPPSGGLVMGIEVVANSTMSMTYASLQIQAANMANVVPFPTLDPVFATNLGSSPTTVLDQQNTTIGWTAQQWTPITFTTPFVYQGGDHLLLDFQKVILCPASSGLAHYTPDAERTPPGTTFDLPIMMVNYGPCGSNAHLGTANTSTGLRHPLRLRVQFLGAPTIVANSGVAPSSYWAIGNSFDLTTYAQVGSWAVQLVDLFAVPLRNNTNPLMVPGVAGMGWVTPGPFLIAVGTGLFTNSSYTATLTVPSNPGLVGFPFVFQSLLLEAQTLAPIWTNATDATLR
jgi:hypothetical protein